MRAAVDGGRWAAGGVLTSARAPPRTLCTPPVHDFLQALMAYNCLHRGSSTLLCNLWKEMDTASTYPLPWMGQYCMAPSRAATPHTLTPHAR